MESNANIPVGRAPLRGWRLFAIGLAVRLTGALMIWLGDGSPALYRKAIVVVGLILMIGGMTVLRYMLLAKLLRKLGRVFGQRRTPVD